MKKKIIFGTLGTLLLLSVALAACTPNVTVNVPAPQIQAPAATAPSAADTMGGAVNTMVQMSIWQQLLQSFSGNNNGGFGHHGGHH